MQTCIPSKNYFSKYTSARADPASNVSGGDLGDIWKSSPGLSQMQLQKFLEQYQTIPKIPKSVVVQHKIGVRMINVKNRTKYHLQNKLR